MATSVDAAEEAFLRGEWVTALTQSKEALTRSILKRGQSIEPAVAMDTDDERLLSVYLQSVFELEQYDEVETATVVVQSLEPLSFEVAIQWTKFLVAMNRSEAAAARIADLQTQYELLQTHVSSAEQQQQRAREYKRLFDVLVFEILLPSENLAAVRERVYSDVLLDELSKQQLLERIDAFVEERVRATAEPAPATTPVLSSIASAFTGSAAPSTTVHASSSSSAKRTAQSAAADADDSSTYVLIGSTALALAVAAVGVVRYGDRLRDAVEGVVPAISKGLADAKYALFEA